MTNTNTKIQHEFIPDCVNLTKFFWCQRRALRRASGLPPFASIHQVWAPPEEAREWVCHYGEVLPGACQDQQSVTADYVRYSTVTKEQSLSRPGLSNIRPGGKRVPDKNSNPVHWMALENVKQGTNVWLFTVFSLVYNFSPHRYSYYTKVIWGGCSLGGCSLMPCGWLLGRKHYSIEESACVNGRVENHYIRI